METICAELFCCIDECVQDAWHLRCMTDGKHVFRKHAVILFCKVFFPQDDGFRLSCCHAAQLGEECAPSFLTINTADACRLGSYPAIRHADDVLEDFAAARALLRHRDSR